MAKSLFSSFPTPGGTPTDRLADLDRFGSNPGNLNARIYAPDNVVDRPPLVVLLHGCTQTAAGYDAGAGWSKLADELGFVLLFPEQRRANNPNLCFNWFMPGDLRRDEGEALSVRQMISAVVREYDVDVTRIFVTGLSAGGAMAVALLAVYPEVFAGGAIIAGLPYGTAKGVPQAIERMTGQGMPDAHILGNLVKEASSHGGKWPTLSVWHGTADKTVSPSNAEAILAQWQAVHGIASHAFSTDVVDGFPRRTWHDADGRAVLEHYVITGMAHGTPVRSAYPEPSGTPGPFMLDVGIASTRRIAAFWGLENTLGKRSGDVLPSAPLDDLHHACSASLPVVRVNRPERIYGTAQKPTAAKGVGQIIEDALRVAGLMR